MPDRSRFYLTTSIAYANNKPGLHTLYEVIGADAIARWHRMLGDDTRFLTGTDEHSINIAQARVDEGRPTARVRRREGRPVPCRPRTPSRISPDRFIRTTDPDHVRAAQEMVRRAYANGDIYLGTYEGWYCPNEGFRTASDVLETPRGTICPNHPDVPLQWLTERNWFFRLSAYQERLERHFADHPEFVQPDYRRNEMLGFIRGGLEDFSISRERTPGDWGIPFPIAENGESSLREDGSWDPEAGKIYVWYDALINYITGAGFPDDPAAFAHWWPADLHIIGKDIARFHTIFWPAMLWSAGLEAPRQVWVHGWLLAAGGERMSKSRGNFLDPVDFVAAFGVGRRALRRRCARCRSTATPRSAGTRSCGATTPTSPTTSGTSSTGPCRWRTGTSTASGRRRARPATRRSAARWADTLAAYADRPRGVPAPRGAGRAVGVRRRRQQARRRRAAVGAREGGQGGRRRRRQRGCAASSATSSRRAGSSALPPRRSCPGPRRALLAQLGHAYPYGRRRQRRAADPRRAAWGAHATEAGRLTAPEPLFPRLDVEADEHGDPAARALVDSHCHLNADRFDDRRRPRPRQPPGWRASSASSSRAGTSRRPSARWRCVDRFPWLDAAVGVHPHDAAKVDDAGWATDRRLGAPTRGSSPSARPASTTTGSSARSADQLTNLRRNLALALDTGKPAILHCRSAAGRRDAQDALVDELRGAGVGGAAWAAAFGDRPPAVIHSFSGPVDYARTVLDLGLAISFSGLVFRARRGGVAPRRPAIVPPRPPPRRDRFAVPRPARRATFPQRAGVGPRHGRWLAERRGDDLGCPGR